MKKLLLFALSTILLLSGCSKIENGTQPKKLEVTGCRNIPNATCNKEVEYTPKTENTKFNVSDVIVYENDLIFLQDYLTTNAVARIIASEGQSVSIRNEVVYVDGKAIKEKYIDNIKRALYYSLFGYFNGTHEITYVKKDKYYVLADDRTFGVDSRVTGRIVREREILGKLYE